MKAAEFLLPCIFDTTIRRSYYHYLDGPKDTSRETAMYAERCRYPAVAYSDLILVSINASSREAVYNIVGHMTVVSLSVLLGTLLFAEDKEHDDARRRLSRHPGG